TGVSPDFLLGRSIAKPIAEIGREPNSYQSLILRSREAASRRIKPGPHGSRRASRSSPRGLCSLVQPLGPVVVFGLGDRRDEARCRRRRRAGCSSRGRSRRLIGALVVAIGLPPERQAEQKEHRSRREDVPGITDQERDEENHANK